MDYAIKLIRVSKRYCVKHKNNTVNGILMKRDNTESYWALKDINLKIKRGERVGIIGPNGSGKTTLMRIIAGITVPTKGSVEVKGKIGSLLNLEAGFHPYLTGGENLYLNSIYFGLTKDDMKKKYLEIVSYSGLNHFIDAPFYTYSTGMKFRLAFSVAIASKCDNLLIDEVISSGDLDFQNKAVETILNIQKKEKLTTITCSHIPRLIISLADTFYKMENGKIYPAGLDKIKELVKLGEKKYKLRYF